MSSQAGQLAETKPPGPFPSTPLSEGLHALVPQIVDVREQGYRFFLSRPPVRLFSDRFKASVFLSWITHSTISPLLNSMAWARAAGKLMYHCSLAFRRMSWTLVGYPIFLSFLVSSYITRYQIKRKSQGSGKKKRNNFPRITRRALLENHPPKCQTAGAGSEPAAHRCQDQSV